jgi:DNA-binding transcriptional LysR family regulator
VNNFRTLDLNLLRVFDSLMSEGSLTRAAEALSITQPAASHALKRLHDWVGEPLFQRSAKGMVPTGRAVALWPSVRAALQALQQTLAPARFDPRQDAVEFHLTMAAAAAATLAPGLVSALARAEAVADLRILPLTTRDPRSLLHDGVADLAVGDFPALMSAQVTARERALLRHLPLHRTDYVCVMRRGHPLSEGELTLDRYCQAQHVLVTVSGQAHAEVDDALALIGRRRRVMLTVNQYTTAGQVITQSDLVTVLPQSFVASVAALQAVVTRPLPIDIAPLTLEMVWLARRDAEPAHRWLRDAVQAAAGFAAPPAPA